MTKARNGARHSLKVKQEAVLLRRQGKTHREIVSMLPISIGTAWLWLKGVKITSQQKRAIEARRRHHIFSDEEKLQVKKRLRPFQYEQQHLNDDLLNKIRHFHAEHGRIPLKREFNDLRIHRLRFGSWNKAVKLAGFDTNPVLFSNKYLANDGHVCDSFSEKIIDDWLSSKGIKHRRSFRYGRTKMTADFLIGSNCILEFFGLRGVQSKYDRSILKKRALCRDRGLNLIEIYPEDIFPNNKLPRLLKSFLQSHP